MVVIWVRNCPCPARIGWDIQVSIRMLNTNIGQNKWVSSHSLFIRYGKMDPQKGRHFFYSTCWHSLRWKTLQVNADIFSELIETTPSAWEDHNSDIFQKQGPKMTIFAPFLCRNGSPLARVLGQRTPQNHPFWTQIDHKSTICGKMLCLKSSVPRRHRRLQI